MERPKGGATVGFTAASKEIVDILRQRSRLYLFSNSMAPSIVGAAIKILDMISTSSQLRDQLEYNTKLFRSEMEKANFDILSGPHPILPVMLYDDKKAQDFASKLLEEGIYVIGFFYPVVPRGKARIRVQISAAHSEDQILKAVQAFIKVRNSIG